MSNGIIANPNVERLVSSLQAVEREASQTWGPFTLFALIKRAESPGLWDVVVAASWLKPNREGIATIAEIVTRRLPVQETVMISHIAPLPPESDFVHRLITLAAGRREELVPTGPLSLDGADIEQGYILAAYSLVPLTQAA